MCCSELCACSVSFLFAALTPDCIRGYLFYFHVSRGFCERDRKAGGKGSMAHRECSMVNIDDSFLNLLFNLRVVRDFHLRGLGRFFYNALENVYGDVNTSTVGQADRWHPHGGEDIESLLLLWSSFWCSICGSVVCGLLHCDYFVERRGEVNGNEQ
ncbi:hypothetical protein CA11_59280 [Gimesia maris]|nr:hypothetical protein CA11_59280 [Gimesia maris]